MFTAWSSEIGNPRLGVRTLGLVSVVELEAGKQPEGVISIVVVDRLSNDMKQEIEENMCEQHNKANYGQK